MPLTAEALLVELVSLFPSFKSHWESDGDLWTDDDGSFTHWGLFTEFSRFVRDNFEKLREGERQKLMGFIESCVAADMSDEIESPLDNAVCTCFLENLAGEPPLSGHLRTYMGPKSVKFFNYWDNPQHNQTEQGKPE